MIGKKASKPNRIPRPRSASKDVEGDSIRTAPTWRPGPRLAEEREAPADEESGVRSEKVPPSDPPSNPAPSDPPSNPVADSFPPPKPTATRRLGRCVLGSEIARGGMATVHIGRWHGAGGFAKTVAVKRLHPQYAGDPAFVNMLLDEARVVSRIRHPNVTSTIDMLDSEGELFIVMDYVHGVTLAHLLRQLKRKKERLPVRIAMRIVNGVLHGLHAAHEATDEAGTRLELIHRDVSPENVIVGVDGYARLIDFGIARALNRHSHSQDGQLKGKLRYLSPEQVMGDDLDGKSDVFSAAIVLWEALAGRGLYRGDNAGAIAFQIATQKPKSPSELRPDVSPALDRIVLKGLEAKREDRWESAADMAEALEDLGGMASFREIGEWVQKVGERHLTRMNALVTEVENMPDQVATESLSMPLGIEGVPERSAEAIIIDDPESADELEPSSSPPKPPRPPPPPRRAAASSAGMVASDVSVDVALPMAQPRRRLAVVAGLVLIGVIIGLIVLGGDETEAPPAPARAAEPAPAPQPEPQPPPPKPEPAPEPVPSVSSSVRPEPAPIKTFQPKVRPWPQPVRPVPPTPTPTPTPNPRLPPGI